MKRLCSIFTTIIVTMAVASTVLGAPPAAPPGTPGMPGPMEGAPSEGASSEGESGASEEPDGSGIPKDEPVSTTGTTYGYQGTFDLETATSEQVNLSDGEWDINDAQLIFWGGSVIQNSGTSSLAVHNSYVRGETAVETAPLAGNPGNLLVAGNIRTTLGIGNSQNFYINSTIASRNWAALSTDAAQPAQQEGGKELSLYAYGSEAITMDGGYGAYSDLFCNLYSYGSHIQAAEIGIISGTYGNVRIGTIGDGEADPDMASVLRDEDTGRWTDKELGSVIEGGRNALMIHSVNLPPYWEYEGYSQEELPLLFTDIEARGSELRTDRSLDRNISYEGQKQAYIDHTAGSVILIKSTNVNMELDHCAMKADENGTGYLVQTVFNNDTMFMNAVPDGAYYPGISLLLNDMAVTGDIAHEDYQRPMTLTIRDTSIEGAMNEYDCEHWKAAAEAEGFTDYALDESYGTHHGLHVILSNASTWKVTGDSRLSELAIGEFSQVLGTIFVDGEQVENRGAMVYEGEILVKPLAEGSEVWEPDTWEPEVWAPEPGAWEQEPDVWEPEVWEPEETTAAILEEIPVEHEHIWDVTHIEPAQCEKEGWLDYRCAICGDMYSVFTEPTGHYYEFSYAYPDYANGREELGHLSTYTCIYCGDSYDEFEYHTGFDPCYCGWTGPVG